VDSHRLESFSDGVFAVAITILVFNLLPVGSHAALTWTLLGSYWPSYFAYVVSFLTIGIMWMNHHLMMGYVRIVDRTMLVLNLLLLMGIVALPFPTALVASHLTSSQPAGAEIAAVVYGLNMIFVALAFDITWLYVYAHREVGSRAHVPRAEHIMFVAGLGGYVAGTLVALTSPLSALVIYALIAVFYVYRHLPVAPGHGLRAQPHPGWPGCRKPTRQRNHRVRRRGWPALLLCLVSTPLTSESTDRPEVPWASLKLQSVAAGGPR
jgi:uncharacterized membrane protein